MEKTVESLAGYVEHIIYRNADNGYTVLNLVSGEDEITCVGIFSAIAEGENIEAQGEYTEHPTYGQQFKVTSFEEKAPEDEEAIERYLGSGAIKGIGLAMAARIVRRFKEDTFRIIEEEPERLAEIKGISNTDRMFMVSSGKIRTGWRTILMESDSGRRMRSQRGLVSGWTLISVCEAESCIHCFRQVGRDIPICRRQS